MSESVSHLICASADSGIEFIAFFAGFIVSVFGPSFCNFVFDAVFLCFLLILLFGRLPSNRTNLTACLPVRLSIYSCIHTCAFLHRTTNRSTNYEATTITATATATTTSTITATTTKQPVKQLNGRWYDATASDEFEPA